MSNQFSINFQGFQVESLILEEYSGPPISEVGRFNMHFMPVFSTTKKKEFACIFECVIRLKEDYEKQLSFTFISEFSTDKNINKTFKDSFFPKINAPAIAYPFLRSFVSTFLVNAGYEPVLLPTVNFVELVKRRESQKQVEKVENTRAPKKTNKLSAKL